MDVLGERPAWGQAGAGGPRGGCSAPLADPPAAERCSALPRAPPSQVYQIYAKRPPEEVHALLRALGADYVILEDSVCYERRHRRGCRLRDLLDVANGHVSARPGVGGSLGVLGSAGVPVLPGVTPHHGLLPASPGPWRGRARVGYPWGGGAGRARSQLLAGGSAQRSRRGPHCQHLSLVGPLLRSVTG